MLAGLSIRNVVLIDQLDLSFEAGLCALTGETGAGKSILLDALGLALGFRAEKTLVRAGEVQAAVTAEFRPANGHPAFALLEQQGIECQESLLLRRVLGADGRSRAFINDQPVSARLLRAMGGLMVEIEGQFAEQGLLDPATHRATLDDYGGLGALVETVAAAWHTWRAAVDAHDQAARNLEAAVEREAELRHHLGEMEALDPKAGEEAELDAKRSLLAHGEKLAEALNAACAMIESDVIEGDTKSGRGMEESLNAAHRHLEPVAHIAQAKLKPALDALERASIEVAEALALLHDFGAELDSDPARLQEIEDRFFALRDLARKHNVAVDELPQLREELAAQLEALTGGGRDVERLAEDVRVTRSAFEASCRELSGKRGQAAKKLDTEVAAELPALKLEKAVFATRLEALDLPQWGVHGAERVGFEVATNPGTPPGPIGRIASGGELARFMLALKVVVAASGTAATLIFDEVDSGIGGAVAAAVGERLCRLGEGRQVLVITHSPQVAARGTTHLRIIKTGADTGVNAGATGAQAKDSVVTRVEELRPAERREEIARMLSGKRITDEARAAAERLLQSA